MGLVQLVSVELLELLGPLDDRAEVGQTVLRVPLEELASLDSPDVLDAAEPEEPWDRLGRLVSVECLALSVFPEQPACLAHRAFLVQQELLVELD